MIEKTALSLQILMPVFIWGPCLMKGKKPVWGLCVGFLCLIVMISLNSLLLGALSSPFTIHRYLFLFSAENFLLLFLCLFVVNSNKTALDKNRPDMALRTSRPRWIGIILILVMTATLIMLATSLQNKPRQGYTEFYLLEDDYDNPIWEIRQSDDNPSVTIVIHSEEFDQADYSLDVFFDGEEIESISLLAIAPGSTLYQQIPLEDNATGLSHYEFRLGMDGVDTYRYLSIWIDPEL